MILLHQSKTLNIYGTHVCMQCNNIQLNTRLRIDCTGKKKNKKKSILQKSVISSQPN